MMNIKHEVVAGSPLISGLYRYLLAKYAQSFKPLFTIKKKWSSLYPLIKKIFMQCNRFTLLLTILWSFHMQAQQDTSSGKGSKFDQFNQKAEKTL